MPELPEVETIRRSLQPVVGRQIASLIFSRLAPVETTSPRAIRRALVGGTIVSLARWGKYLLFRVEQGASLVIHLGMTGQLRLWEPVEESVYGNGSRGLQRLGMPLTGSTVGKGITRKGGGSVGQRHTHLQVNFADGSALHFSDPRRFGTLSLSSDPLGADNPFLARLGPDYLDPTLTSARFIGHCRRHPKLSLKNAALHQGIAAGLGNIYACESLYRASLDPRRRVAETSDAGLAALLAAAREVLALGIAKGGTTLRDYLDGLGSRGMMKQFLQVYGREGQWTLDGRGRVTRIIQQARSTFYCPSYQH